jgi:hypothetical protein
VIKFTDLKTEGGSLNKECPSFIGTKIGSSSCVHCRFFVDADDNGSPTFVNCYGWRNGDILNRELILLMDDIKRAKRNGLG